MKYRATHKRRFAMALLGSSVCLCVNGALVLAHASNAVLVSRGRLTATLQQVPLKTVLQELQQQTGLKYTLPREEADRPISVAFTALPLRTGLSRILAHVNHAISFDANGMPVQVIIGKKAEGGGERTPKSLSPSDAGNMMSASPVGLPGEVPPPGVSPTVETPPVGIQGEVPPPGVHPTVEAPPWGLDRSTISPP